MKWSKKNVGNDNNNNNNHNNNKTKTNKQYMGWNPETKQEAEEKKKVKEDRQGGAQSYCALLHPFVWL